MSQNENAVLDAYSYVVTTVGAVRQIMASLSLGESVELCCLRQGEMTRLSLFPHLRPAWGG